MKPLRLILVLLPLAGCSKEAATPMTEAPAERAADAEGFVPLGVSDFTLYSSSKDAAKLKFAGDGDGTIKLLGDGRGYAYSRKSYRNFTLRLEYRWPKAAELPEAERPNANTGVLVFITGENKVWPKCLEVQGKWSEMGDIRSNAKDVSVTVRDDEAAREKARKAVGEWNAVEIVAKDGALTSYVNGVEIAECDPTELREGPIGLQAERFNVEFRNVRVRED
jgi:hypothetical protein